VRVLLDTHAFLWWMADDARLSSPARAVISDRDNTLALSAASAWEIGIKVAQGRLRLPIPVGHLLSFAVQEQQLERLSIEFDHALAAATLPPIHHDPFDRILVAQAQALGCAIVTGDPEIARYAVEVIW
jgi:PIN domain nuclease of toxin-antitoxin system